MNEFVLIVIVTSLILAGITCMLGMLVRMRFIKYIPAILAGAVSIALFIKSRYFSEGFEGLGYFVLMMISIPVFIISLVTAVIIELVRRKRY